MSVQEDPYLSTYLRKPRIPDTVVVPGPGDQSKTMLPPRRRPRVPKDLDAGPLEAEVGSFALHMAAEGKAPRTIRNYTEAVRWFAAAYLLRETEKRRWEQVDKADLRRWTVRLLGEYSTAYAGNQFRAVRRFLRWLAIEEDRPDPVKGLRAPGGEGHAGAGVHQRRTFRAAQGVPGPQLRGPARRRDPGRVRGDRHPALGAGRDPVRPGRSGARRPEPARAGRSGSSARAASPGSSRSAMRPPGAWTGTCGPGRSIRWRAGRSCGSG